MQLNKKKSLASRALDVGENRIVFNKNRLEEIKEAITKQDIKDLVKDKAIILKEKSGRKKIIKRKNRRRGGSVKIKRNERKRNYMTLTRKLRSFILELKKSGKIDYDIYKKLRNEIRAKSFKSKSNMKERIASLTDYKIEKVKK